MPECKFKHNTEAICRVKFKHGGCFVYPNEPEQDLCEQHLLRAQDGQSGIEIIFWYITNPPID